MSLEFDITGSLFTLRRFGLGAGLVLVVAEAAAAAVAYLSFLDSFGLNFGQNGCISFDGGDNNFFADLNPRYCASRTFFQSERWAPCGARNCPSGGQGTERKANQAQIDQNMKE